MTERMGAARALPEILLLTHGHLGDEMVRSARMIVGDIEGVHTIPLTPEQSPEEYRALVGDAAAALAEGSIILADLFGGTPCNTAAILSRTRALPILAGVNLTALIESVQLREEYEGEELCDKVLEGAKGSIRIITL